jgi:hypothetical protein
VSIETGTEAVNFDGYVIRSALGGIDPTEWNSLQDQMLSDWRESSSPGTENGIAELKPTTSTAVTSGVPLQLGSLFDKPLATVFGTQELEDFEFEYYTPDGSTIQAEVIYEGEKQYNNLVLIVDPVDGDAILQNQSNLSVSIDGYNIHSDSGSLLPNDGDWLSLEDQGVGAWRESGETVNDLSELLPTGSTSLSGGTTFNLDSPFRTESNGGIRDLAFSYLLPGDTQFTESVVVYRDVDFQLLPGDYNGDGKVDAADYVVWRKTDGSPGGYNAWRSNFGMSAAGASIGLSTASVPEPTGFIYVAMAIAALAFCRRSF